MANTKFKVGDKVKITLPGYLAYENVVIVKAWQSTMTGKNFYSITIDGKEHPCNWYDHELELVEPNPFTKSDLKDGMVVRTRDKGNFLVLGDVLLDDYEKINLDNYKSDLIHNASPILDIMAVYSVQTCAVDDIYDAMCVDDDCHKLIWEREEEHKEMTVEEIEEKLGYKIKVVGND